MLKPRLIPVLLFKNGVLVRSQYFDFFQSTGDPIGQVERFTEWKADELIYLDISRDDVYSSQGTMQNIVEPMISAMVSLGSQRESR